MTDFRKASDKRRAEMVAERLRPTRKCNQCGVDYDGRTGKGGGSAREGDAEKYPYDVQTMTGVLDTHPWWMHGAHCSDECYEAAYYEPPYPYGP